MPEILDISSKRGLVKFSEEDLINLGLIKWIRTSFKGIGKRGLIQDTPFETAAAKVYVDKNPQSQVHIAEKCILNHDGSVDVILKVSKDVSSEMYNQHSTNFVLRKQKKVRGSALSELIKQAAGYAEYHLEQVIPKVNEATGEVSYYPKDFNTRQLKDELVPVEEFDETMGIEDFRGDLMKIGDRVDIIADFVGLAGVSTKNIPIKSYQELQMLDDAQLEEYMSGIGIDTVHTQADLVNVSETEYLDYVKDLEHGPESVDIRDQSPSIIEEGIIRFWVLEKDYEALPFEKELRRTDPTLKPSFIASIVDQMYGEELAQLPPDQKESVRQSLIKEEYKASLYDKLEELMGDMPIEVPYAVVEIVDSHTGQPTGEFYKVVHYELDKLEPGEKSQEAFRLHSGAYKQQIQAIRIANLQRLASRIRSRVASKESDAYDKNQMTDLPKGQNLDVTFPEKQQEEKEEEQRSFQQVLDETIKKEAAEAPSVATSTQFTPAPPQAEAVQGETSSPLTDTSNEDVSNIQGRMS